MATQSGTTTRLIGQILHPSGASQPGIAHAEAAGSFAIEQIIAPRGAAPAGAPPAEPPRDEPYQGPERRAPQVIIAEPIDDTPAEPKYPPLPR